VCSSDLNLIHIIDNEDWMVNWVIKNKSRELRYKYVGKSEPVRPRNEDLLRARREADKPLEISTKAYEGDACELPGGDN
jgi:hypothetical protein